MANLKKRGRFYSLQFRWDGKQHIKPLRMEKKADAERVKIRVESALDGLRRGRHPAASRLLEEGHDVLDIIFPEKTAPQLKGQVATDDGNPLKVSRAQVMTDLTSRMSNEDQERIRGASVVAIIRAGECRMSRM